MSERPPAQAAVQPPDDSRSAPPGPGSDESAPRHADALRSVVRSLLAAVRARLERLLASLRSQWNVAKDRGASTPEGAGSHGAADGGARLPARHGGERRDGSKRRRRIDTFAAMKQLRRRYAIALQEDPALLRRTLTDAQLAALGQRPWLHRALFGIAIQNATDRHLETDARLRPAFERQLWLVRLRRNPDYRLGAPVAFARQLRRTMERGRVQGTADERAAQVLEDYQHRLAHRGLLARLGPGLQQRFGFDAMSRAQRARPARATATPFQPVVDLRDTTSFEGPPLEGLGALTDLVGPQGTDVRVTEPPPIDVRHPDAHDHRRRVVADGRAGDEIDDLFTDAVTAHWSNQAGSPAAPPESSYEVRVVITAPPGSQAAPLGSPLARAQMGLGLQPDVADVTSPERPAAAPGGATAPDGEQPSSARTPPRATGAERHPSGDHDNGLSLRLDP